MKGLGVGDSPAPCMREGSNSCLAPCYAFLGAGEGPA